MGAPLFLVHVTRESGVLADQDINWEETGMGHHREVGPTLEHGA
jgi:hypothetical protein